MAHEKYVRETFQRFDIDNTGYISLDNLRDVLGDEYHGIEVEKILDEVDYKHNGKIDYEEFMRAVVFDGRDTSAEAEEENKLMSIERRNSKLVIRKTLLAKIQGKADLQDGASSFTWGACRNDATFKLNTNVLDELEDFDTSKNATLKSTLLVNKIYIGVFST